MILRHVGIPRPAVPMRFLSTNPGFYTLNIGQKNQVILPYYLFNGMFPQQKSGDGILFFLLYPEVDSNKKKSDRTPHC